MGGCSSKHAATNGASMPSDASGSLKKAAPQLRQIPTASSTVLEAGTLSPASAHNDSQSQVDGEPAPSTAPSQCQESLDSSNQKPRASNSPSPAISPASASPQTSNSQTRPQSNGTGQSSSPQPSSPTQADSSKPDSPSLNFANQTLIPSYHALGSVQSLLKSLSPRSSNRSMGTGAANPSHGLLEDALGDCGLPIVEGEEDDPEAVFDLSLFASPSGESGADPGEGDSGSSEGGSIDENASPDGVFIDVPTRPAVRSSSMSRLETPETPPTRIPVPPSALRRLQPRSLNANGSGTSSGAPTHRASASSDCISSEFDQHTPGTDPFGRASHRGSLSGGGGIASVERSPYRRASSAAAFGRARAGGGKQSLAPRRLSVHRGAREPGKPWSSFHAGCAHGHGH